MQISFYETNQTNAVIIIETKTDIATLKLPDSLVPMRLWKQREITQSSPTIGYNAAKAIRSILATGYYVVNFEVRCTEHA